MGYRLDIYNWPPVCISWGMKKWASGWILKIYQIILCSFYFGSDGKESTCNTGDLCLIPGLGRFPGEGDGYPLQTVAWRIPEEPSRLHSP